MQNATITAKPKKRLRRRHVKKALIITLYSFVAVVMIVGIIGPAFQQ